MKNSLMLLLLTASVPAFSGCQKEGAPPDQQTPAQNVTAEPPSVDQLKQMISRAASIPVEQFKAIAEMPVMCRLGDLSNQPLTLMIVLGRMEEEQRELDMILPEVARAAPLSQSEPAPREVAPETEEPAPREVAPESEEPRRDLRPLGSDGMIRANLLAEAICPSLKKPGRKASGGDPGEYASIIRPEYITECTRTVKGKSITGKVSFRAKDAYEGTVEYTAGLGPDGWRIEEFRLPVSGDRTVLTVRGEWIAQRMYVSLVPPEPPEPVDPPPPPLVVRPRELFVNIDRQGRYFVAGKVLSLKELKSVLVRAHVNNPGRQAVVIRADKRCQWEHVVAVMNACRDARIRDYRVTTFGSDGPPPGTDELQPDVVLP